MLPDNQVRKAWMTGEAEEDSIMIGCVMADIKVRCVLERSTLPEWCHTRFSSELSISSCCTNSEIYYRKVGK